MIFGETLKELRTDRGLSQQQLADELKISRSAIAKWELSKTEPVASMIVKLAKYFDVDSDFLLGLRDLNFRNFCNALCSSNASIMSPPLLSETSDFACGGSFLF